CFSVAACTASPASAPVACATTAPSPSTITARAAARSVRSRPRLSIDVPLHFAPLERQCARCVDPEQVAIHLREQFPQPALVGGREDDHARSFVGRKTAIVEVVAIQGDE